MKVNHDEINLLTGNAEALAKMAGLNLRLVQEGGRHRAYLNGQRLYSVRSRKRLRVCLETVCEECDRAWLDSIGREARDESES